MIDHVLRIPDVEKVSGSEMSYVQLWTQGMRNQCGGEMRDIINPRLDFGQIDWEQSTRFSFVYDIVGDFLGLPRILLYEHCSYAESRGDDAKKWLIARFSDDPVLLGFFLKYEGDGDIVLIAAMRMVTVLEYSPLSPRISFFGNLFDGLRRMDEEHLDLFFCFLCGDDEGYVQSIQNALCNYKFSEFERLITLSFRQ